MMERIDHLGIAVSSIEQRIGFWRDVLGLELIMIEEVPDQRVKVAMLPIAGTKIELLEPTSPDSPIARFIETRGEGVHHVAFGVDDIAAALDCVRDSGCRLIDEVPRRGAGGALIAFVHPKSAGGVLVELCQRDH